MVESIAIGWARDVVWRVIRLDKGEEEGGDDRGVRIRAPVTEEGTVCRERFETSRSNSCVEAGIDFKAGGHTRGLTGT
jgi:hypothetical protein